MASLKKILLSFFCAMPFFLMAQYSSSPLTIAEQMPYFQGCEQEEDGTEEKRICSNNNLINFISSNIKYPEEAKTKGLEGTVLLSFIVNKFGQIESSEILRDIGGGCAEEALRIVELMPEWEPAINEGKEVSVKLNLPVTFSLRNVESSIKNNYQIHWGGLKGNNTTKNSLEENLNTKLFVRDEFGDNVDVSSLTFIYHRNRSYYEETSTGKITSSLSKVIKKIKRGGVFTIVATILVSGEFLEIERQFIIEES